MRVEISRNRGGMAKPKNEWEKLPMRFPVGTFERMEKMLKPGEDRTTLIRTAVDAELTRREASAGETGGGG